MTRTRDRLVPNQERYQLRYTPRYDCFKKSGQRDSNTRPPGPKPGTLPTALYPVDIKKIGCFPTPISKSFAKLQIFSELTKKSDKKLFSLLWTLYRERQEVILAKYRRLSIKLVSAMKEGESKKDDAVLASSFLLICLLNYLSSTTARRLRL